MKPLTWVARGLLGASIIMFAAGWWGLVYYRFLQPFTDLTAAWRDALSALGAFGILAIFLALLAIYLRMEVHTREEGIRTMP